VGYRCRECVNAQQRTFYAGFGLSDYVIAGVVAFPLSMVAGWLVPQLGWYSILLGPIVGGGIAEAARWAIKRKRGEYTWLVVCGCIVVGTLPVLVLTLLRLIGLMGGAPGLLAYWAGGIMRLVWVGVYLLTGAGAAYARLRPGRRI
jgi:hypothetical protein